MLRKKEQVHRCSQYIRGVAAWQGMFLQETPSKHCLSAILTELGGNSVTLDCHELQFGQMQGFGELSRPGFVI